MDIRKSFGVDKKLAEEGKWFDLEEGGSVKVAKLGNPAFAAEVQRLQKPHIATLRSGLNNSEILSQITVKAMAKTILTDWKNISMDGSEFPYSQENAEYLLTEFPDFKEIISQLSVERKNFIPEEVGGK